MEAKIPTHLLKPQHLSEIPRSKYVVAPQLKSADENSRKSFISMLRKGPSPTTRSKRLPTSVSINCAIWLSFSKPIDTCITLLLHCSESREDYCLILDEAVPHNAESLMLSGSAEIYPKSEIKRLDIVCSGIPKEYHTVINDIHIESKISTISEALRQIS
jgi:hypothetical protein